MLLMGCKELAPAGSWQPSSPVLDRGALAASPVSCVPPCTCNMHTCSSIILAGCTRMYGNRYGVTDKLRSLVTELKSELQTELIRLRL